MLELRTGALRGADVVLEPITPDDAPDMRDLLDRDPEHWAIASGNGSGDGFPLWWSGALDRREQGGVTYAIRRTAAGRMVGTSSYLNPRPEHRIVEIGATFLHPEVRGGTVNPASKLLLLSHAFAAGAVRVEFMIDIRNARSQAAVAKLGAVREGVLRRSKITWTGHVRDTAVYSVTDVDWPEVEARLRERLLVG